MHYADFKSLGGDADDAFAPGGPILIGRLLTLVHRAAKGREFSVSFPEYATTPSLTAGSVLRVFADDKEILTGLLADQKLASYVMGQFEFSGIKRVDPQRIAGWSTFSRHRPKSEKYSPSNTERASRRQAAGKRAGGTPDYLALRTAKSLSLQTPFLRVQSKSRQTEFPLYIQRAEAKDQGNGGFDAYGLSRGSATPIFSSLA